MENNIAHIFRVEVKNEAVYVSEMLATTFYSPESHHVECQASSPAILSCAVQEINP
jgi:hypothetical protein